MYTKIAVVSSFLIIGAGSGITGTYFIKQEKLSEMIDSNMVLSKADAEEGWAKLKEEFKSKKANSSVFENINETNLETVCENSLQKTYKTIFSEDKSLLKDFKSFCTITFSNLGGKEKSFKNKEDSKDKAKEKLKELKKHKEENNYLLEEEMKKIKGKIGDTETWEEKITEEFIDLCQSKYEKYFTKEDSEWKSVKNYCFSN